MWKILINYHEHLKFHEYDKLAWVYNNMISVILRKALSSDKQS